MPWATRNQNKIDTPAKYFQSLESDKAMDKRNKPTNVHTVIDVFDEMMIPHKRIFPYISSLFPVMFLIYDAGRATCKFILCGGELAF